MTVTFPGLLPEQAQVQPFLRNLPSHLNPMCSANQPTITGGMAINEINTEQFKPQNIFHGIQHFSSVKAVTFCSNGSSI